MKMKVFRIELKAPLEGVRVPEAAMQKVKVAVGKVVIGKGQVVVKITNVAMVKVN